MNCYHHPQAGAVAQCAHCGKGLCSDCTFESGDIWCYTCFRDATNVDYLKARHRITGLWIFVALVTAVGTIMVISSNGAGGILLAPVIFAGAWCFYWGWGPFWRWIRGQGFSVTYVSSGGGDPIGTIFRLMLLGLFIEVLIFIILGIGLFTGIQKFLRDRRTIAISNQGWLNMFPGKYVPDMGYVPAGQHQLSR